MPKRRARSPIEYSGKLVYPTPISINHRTARPDKHGTYGFVKPTNNDHTFVKEWIELHRKFKKTKNLEGQRHAAEMIFQNLRAMAHQSDFFMRETPPKIRFIRERLKKAGIRVEEPIQDLQDGRELFARGENMPLLVSPYGIAHSPLRDCRGAIAQIIRMIARMHVAGIVHGHPHLNNFVVDKQGRLTMIDLGMARHYPKQPRNAKEFIKRYAIDFQRSGLALASLLYEVPGTKWYGVEANGLDTASIVVDRMLKLHQKLGMNTFNVTARELLLPADNK